MNSRELYSIKEARELLGGISRNSIYELLRSGRLPSVVLGCRRFISAAAIVELIAKSTTTVSPSLDYARSRMPTQKTLALRLPSVIGTKSRKVV
jgi:excisionase family DNA binding protein